MALDVCLKAITKRFGKVVAVDDLTLEIPGGKVTCLLGPSGCGKTTTLRIVGGLENPDWGIVEFNGKDVTITPAFKRGIAMVFQNYALFPHMRVFDNVAFGLRMKRPRWSERSIRERVAEVLSTVSMEGLEDRFPHELSGGQQQRVAVARAIAPSPRILLMDEPLSNLDAKLREQTRKELRELQQRLGITVLYVTHDQEEAMEISDVIALLNVGKLVQMGSPKELYEYPTSTFAATFLGKCNLLPATLVAVERPWTRCLLEGTDSTVLALGAGEHRAGDQVQLAVRPARISLERGGRGAGNDNWVSGSIRYITFRGERLEIELGVGSEGLRLLVEVPAADSLHWPVGSCVVARWPKEHTNIIGG